MNVRGTVKKITDKDFGFIHADGYNDDIWFHFSNYKSDTPTVGAEVNFELFEREDGKLNAKNVRVVGQNGIAQEYRKPKTNAKYFLPTDTSERIEKLLLLKGKNVENSALMVEKYVLVPQNKGKFVDGKLPRFFSKKENDLLDFVNKAQNDTLGHIGYTIIGKLKSRMVIGLGSASVFETGIIMHKPYGFPYIPGSGIKGAFRSFLLNEYGNDYDQNKLNYLFGTNEPEPRKGKLVFFDAYPVKIEKLAMDVMTPHFKEWHETADDKICKKVTAADGKVRKEVIAPTDNKDPVPIKFLTVPAGTKFTFRIGGGISPDLQEKFQEMLEYAGLGAKKAVGYGWFMFPPDKQLP